MMSGYWNRPDANREVVWTDGDGRHYIRTGDIGEFDAAGFLRLRGRKKDMLISGGLNVYPVDIEAVLLEHPAVDEVAVFGIDDVRWGEVPVAVVRLYHATSIDGLAEWASDRLAKHQRLRDIRAWPSPFPRNTLGKVLKNQLRDAYMAQTP